MLSPSLARIYFRKPTRLHIWKAETEKVSFPPTSFEGILDISNLKRKRKALDF
jgi:hypothetical protein